MRSCPLLLIACALIALAAGRPDPTRPAPTFKLDGNALVLPSPVAFLTGSDVLHPTSAAAIRHVVAYLAARRYVSQLRIEVHSDSQGSDAANQAMTERRALAVARALVAAGADCRRLVPVGFGETKPIASNRTAEGRAQNRRVGFVNAALNGRLIGGMPADGGGRVAGSACPPPRP